MAFKQILDSDVDRITAMAIQGVNAFITLYDVHTELQERDEQVVAAGPQSRAKRASKAPPKAAPRRKRL